MDLVASGQAQCVLGNHELNALVDDETENRPGEGWWYGRNDPGYRSVCVDPLEKDALFRPFLDSLPVALERPDLRVVHACWDEHAIKAVRAFATPMEAFHVHRRQNRERLKGLRADAREQTRAWDMKDGATTVPFLRAKAVYDEAYQNDNPVRVLTSGKERVRAGNSRYLHGKWRMVERVAWWNEQRPWPPVVFGHYWRTYAPPEEKVQYEQDDPFAGTRPDAWLGSGMCVDYSVGRRYQDRRQPGRPTDSRYGLGALRIPEWTVLFDDERTPLEVGPPINGAAA